jgi:hypothetical protein
VCFLFISSVNLIYLSGRIMVNEGYISGARTLYKQACFVIASPPFFPFILNLLFSFRHVPPYGSYIGSNLTYALFLSI